VAEKTLILKAEMTKIEEVAEKTLDLKKIIANLLNLKKGLVVKKILIVKQSENNLFHKFFNSLKGCFFWSVILNCI